MDTKEKIIEALDENGIKDIDDAIEYLHSLKIDVFENQFKWEAETPNGTILHFTNDEELTEWAKEEKYKIEEI